jgi:hypothetical protein
LARTSRAMTEMEMHADQKTLFVKSDLRAA